jgi:alpha-N-arabinofuranosidase
LAIDKTFRTIPDRDHGAMAGISIGETLTAPKVDSVNSFKELNTVVPKPISAKVQGGMLALKLEPKSLTVISVEQ